MEQARAQKFSDALFVVQGVCALLFGGGQFVRMLTTAQGVSMSFFVFWEVALVLNLILAFRAHRAQPSRATTQVLVIYILWTVMVTADLAVMIVKGTSQWDLSDTHTALFVIAGILATCGVAIKNNLPWADPMIKAYFSVFFKGVPQLTMAYKLATQGIAGLAGTTVVTGEITNITRLGQILFTVREAGWDRNRRGGAIAEFASTVTWTVIALVWVVKALVAR